MLCKKLKTLNARLLSIVLLAMLPVLFVALLMASDRYQEARNSAVESSRHLARVYAAGGKALFDRTKSLMAEISTLPAIRNLDGAACAEVLSALGRMHPAYDAITLSRPDGRPVCTSLNSPGQSILSHQDWFTEVLQAKTFVVGTYQGGKDGSAALPLALPVQGPDGSVQAVLSMSLSLNSLADLLDDMPLPEGAAVSIIDGSGTILARYPADPEAVGQVAPDAHSFMSLLFEGGLEVWESRGVDGVERIYFLSPLLSQKGRGIFLRIGMPSKAAFADADQELLRNLCFIAVMTLVTLFATWFFSNSLVLRHIKKLWLATRILSEGDFSHRIGVSGSHELAELAMAFDSMAEVLEDKTYRLITAEQKYRKIFENSVSGIFQSSPEGRILRANSALAALLGFQTPQEMIQKVVDIAGQLYAEPEMRQEVLRRLTRDGVLTAFELPARRKDGGLVWLSLDARAVRGQDGAIAYFEGTATDITPRIRIEQELKAKQQQLEGLLDHSPTLISIKDAEGRYVLSNRRHQEVHGLDQGVVGKTVNELFPPEVARIIREEDHRVLSKGEALTVERPLPIKGVLRHFLTAKFPLHDDSGRPDRICSISYDITDYEHLREALRQSEAKFQTMIQTSPDLIWMLDPDGFLVEVNNASRELLGYDPDELRGKHFSQVFHPEDAHLHDRERILPLYAGRTIDAEGAPKLINERRREFRPTRNLSVRLVPRDIDDVKPDSRSFELSACGVWQDMQFLGTVVVIRDITERKRAEASVRETQELLNQTQTIGKIGGWSINLDTRERKGTQELYRLLGLTGNTLPDFDEAAGLVAPEYRALYTEVVRRAEELGEPFDVELRLAQQGTTQRWVRFMGNRTDSGGARIFSGSVQEITDKKNLEMLRDDIDSIIRHDLKTPLNGIINLPQLILGEKNLSPEQVKLLLLIEECGWKMLRQIEMSLDIVKIERGQYQFSPTTFDILQVFRVIVSDQHDATQRKNLGFDILVHGVPAEPSSTFPVHAEERLCYPLFSNLILNALEASPMGERIVISLSGDADVLVSIRNAGSVPSEIQDRFFDKYVTRGKPKGTGLGTYSASLFVRAQGGSIVLDCSRENETTVIVRLPKNAGGAVAQ